MSIPQWALEAGVKGAIKDAETDGKVAELADMADKAVKSFFPGSAKQIKFMLVNHLVFPFAKLFLKDDPDGYAKAKVGL